MSIPPSGRNPTSTPKTKHIGGEKHERTTSKPAHPQAPTDIKSQQPPDPEAAPKPSTLNPKHTEGDHKECAIPKAVHPQTLSHTKGRHPSDSTATLNPGRNPTSTSKPERTGGNHQECNTPKTTHPQTPRHTKGRHLPNPATTPKPGKQTTSSTQTSPHETTLKHTDRQTPSQPNTERTVSTHLQRRDAQQPQGTKTSHMRPTDRQASPRSSTECTVSSHLRQTNIDPTLRPQPCRPNRFQERRQHYTEITPTEVVAQTSTENQSPPSKATRKKTHPDTQTGNHNHSNELTTATSPKSPPSKTQRPHTLYRRKHYPNVDNGNFESNTAHNSAPRH